MTARPDPAQPGPAPPPSPRALRQRLGRALARRPWIGRAVRTTGAAVLAWVVVGLVPGPWSDYPYYAPLGAVVATSVTVRGSTRRSAQAVLAIALGAVVARLVDLLPVPPLPALALVVLVGVLLSGWRVLGDMGSWLPTSALFVLVIGDADPVGYVSAYVGLTLVGAAIGVGVNALLPPLPLTPADRALGRLAEATAAHLGGVADAVADDDAPVPDGAALRAARAAAGAAVRDAQDAARANWTASRYRDWRARLATGAGRLDAAAGIALDVARAVRTSRDASAARREHPERVPLLPLAPDADTPADPARDATAAALRAGATLVRTLPGGGADDAGQRFAEALTALRAAVAAGRPEDGSTRPADAVLVALAPLSAPDEA
ncbi:hypothetical protein HNR08_004034 [Cellulomonas hominis]|uniref:FUSC family protein n=1 Tax=Cellulomonas hominis TaxID=156981 RepID=A0A7W8SHN1_9CELL|nr:hypothetical protein [Cellulomonas hominis]MBB5475298.1 hypothetical protein [Cellulomonas hominis]